MIEGKSFSEIFSSPERWHKGAYYADKDGAPTPGDDETTERCCLIGAKELIAIRLGAGLSNQFDYDPKYIAVWDALKRAVSEVSGIEESRLIVPDYNDHKATFEDIQRIAKRADEILFEIKLRKLALWLESEDLQMCGDVFHDPWYAKDFDQKKWLKEPS